MSENSVMDLSVFADLAESLSYALRLFPAKAAIATVVVLITEAWGWEVIVFRWYCFFAVADLVVGIAQAIVFDGWNVQRIRRWCYRLATELCVIVLVSGVFHSLFAVTGRQFFFANWLFILCILTYFSSVLDRLHTLGAPLPAFLAPVLRAVRRRAAVHFSALLDDEKITEELEKAIAAHHQDNHHMASREDEKNHAIGTKDRPAEKDGTCQTGPGADDHTQQG